MKPSEKDKQVLLDKYIRNDISRDDLLRLNEWALDDDMLFEAMEGLSISESSNAKNIDELRRLIGKKSKRRKLVFIISSAAAVILLAFVATIALNRTNPEMLATQEANKDLNESENIEIAVDFGTEELTKEKSEAIPPNIESDLNKNSIAKQNEREIDDFEPAIEKIDKENEVTVVGNRIPQPKTDLSVEEYSISPAPMEEKISSRKEMAVSGGTQASEYILTGKVKDELNNPVEGSTVYIPDFDSTVQTDAAGSFTLNLPSKPAVVEVEKEDFRSSKLELQENRDLDITLISEKQIPPIPTGKSSRSKKIKKDESQFPDFVTQNQVIPKAFLDSGLEYGEVELEFEIFKKGFVSQLKVSKSLGFGCDEEAIRLIQAFKYWSKGKHVQRISFSKK